ncbi:hypothetical protein [Kribbella sancticallisti]
MKTLTFRLDEFPEVFNDALPQGLPLQQRRQMAAIARTWSDPLSLGYQAQVHATFAPAASRPKHQGRMAIWHQCAHNHWFFLPWHLSPGVRGRRPRPHQGAGRSGRRLGPPYWNYSDHQTQPEALGLPKPLRGADLPADVTIPGVPARVDESFPNPLFDPTRS